MLLVPGGLGLPFPLTERRHMDVCQSNLDKTKRAWAVVNPERTLWNHPYCESFIDKRFGSRGEDWVRILLDKERERLSRKIADQNGRPLVIPIFGDKSRLP